MSAAKIEVLPARKASPKPETITAEDLLLINSKEGLRELMRAKRIRIKPILERIQYERDLNDLQIELVQLQRSVQEKNRRVAILFEGRDAAGKGSGTSNAIRNTFPTRAKLFSLTAPGTTAPSSNPSTASAPRSNTRPTCGKFPNTSTCSTRTGWS